MKFTINGQVFRMRPARFYDYAFAYALAKKNMEQYTIKHWGGWIPQRFKEGYNKKNISIITRRGLRVGYLDVTAKEGAMYISNIQTVNSVRGVGLGSFLIRSIESEAARQGFKHVRLRVFKDNPAKKLYAKLGYHLKKDDGNSIILEKNL